MDNVSLYLPELLIVIWMISFVYRINRRLVGIEQKLAALEAAPRP